MRVKASASKFAASDIYPWLYCRLPVPGNRNEGIARRRRALPKPPIVLSRAPKIINQTDVFIRPHQRAPNFPRNSYVGWSGGDVNTL